MQASPTTGALERGGQPRGLARDAWNRRERVRSSSRRIGPTHPRRRAPALGRPPRGYVRRGFSRAFPSGFLARVRTARARATGGVCDAARASHALSELKRVHGRDGTRVVCVAMPRPVHHASQTATRRRSRVFRVSPVQAIWRKSIVPDEGTGGRRLRLASRGARAIARTPHPASPASRARLDADDPFDSIPHAQVEEPPLAPSTRCPSRAPSAR